MKSAWDKALAVGNIVVVDWVDSVSPLNVTWVQVDELTNELPVISTAGRVHASSAWAVTITSSWSESHPTEVAGVMTIPCAAITGVLVVE